MLVHLCSHPLANTTPLPRSAVRALAAAARHAGAAVIEDDRSLPGADLPTSVASCAEGLRRQWRDQRPDLVHTFGLAATMAAVEVGGDVPIIATFDESPTLVEAELGVAACITAVMPLSTAEGEAWRRRGVPILSAGIFPAPIRTEDQDPFVAGPTGSHVVTFSDGPVLDCLVSALSRWGTTHLVVGTRLAAQRWAVLSAHAAERGVLDRLHHRPGLRGRARSRMWASAAMLVAGPEGSRHGGYVLEAAAHGVPTVATAEHAHLDHVVAGTSGILFPPGAPSRELSKIVTALVEDPYRRQALGFAAHVRVRAAHDPRLAGDRLLGLYRKAVAHEPREVMDAQHHGSGEPGADAQGPSRSQVPGAPDLDSDAVDRDVRDALVTTHLPLARQLAGWYTGRGQAREDLVQVAYLGLVLAAGRFDPAHGTPFHSFAVPTILGELRRHFRDHAWQMRVPRAMQESVLEVRRAADDLQQLLGRESTPADLAASLDMGEERVRAALWTARRARGADSLDRVTDEGHPLAERLGTPDPGHDLADVRSDVRAVLQRLPVREQQVLLMRFHAEMTQSEIADRLGISQVHVSRLITRTLAAIRDHVLSDSPLPPAWTHRQAEPSTGTARRIARAS
jgi:RNA polymerase sigma-B factor